MSRASAEKPSLHLQRVVVRMLFDEQFRTRVYADPQALEGLLLDPEARHWLIRHDPRAFGTDPHRKGRAFTALLHEFPAASALAAAELGGAPALESFFGSRPFHDGVQQGESMASAFGKWLALAAPTPQIVAVAALEAAVAALQRAPRVRRVPGRLLLGERRALHRGPFGLAALLEAVRERLGSHPVSAILEGVLPGELPALASRETTLLIEGGSHPRLEELPEALAEVLELALAPRTRAELETKAVTLGATPEEAVEIVDELLADGTLG